MYICNRTDYFCLCDLYNYVLSKCTFVTNSLWTRPKMCYFNQIFVYCFLVQKVISIIKFFNLLSSGTYFPLICPSEGQNIPTQHSNTRKPTNIINWFWKIENNYHVKCNFKEMKHERKSIRNKKKYIYNMYSTGINIKNLGTVIFLVVYLLSSYNLWLWPWKS